MGQSPLPSRIAETLPFWVMRNYKAPAASFVSPATKSGGQWAFSAYASTITQVSNSISAVSDASGNARNTSFSTNAIWVPSYTNSKPGIQFSSTSFGTFNAGAALITAGTPFGLYIVCQNVTEAGTYYHTPICFAEAAGTHQNFNFVLTNDTANYGTLQFGMIPAGGGVLVTPGTPDLTTNPVAIIINYNGGTLNAPGSYEMYLNNTLQSLSATIGSNNNSANADYVNSYGNTAPPPAFPATNCYMPECWLYNSVISATDRANIFKGFSQNYYGIAQA